MRERLLVRTTRPLTSGPAGVGALQVFGTGNQNFTSNNDLPRRRLYHLGATMSSHSTRIGPEPSTYRPQTVQQKKKAYRETSSAQCLNYRLGFLTTLWRNMEQPQQSWLPCFRRARLVCILWVKHSHHACCLVSRHIATVNSDDVLDRWIINPICSVGSNPPPHVITASL